MGRMIPGSVIPVSCLIMVIASCALAQGGSDLSLAINEVMASNSETKADPQGQYDDWIELYNYGTAPIDAGGLYLTDDPNEPAKWQIPADDPVVTTIAPGGYLLIWADGETEVEGLHAAFKLDAAGEGLCLFDSDGATLIDSVTFPQLPTDLSYGRCPTPATSGSSSLQLRLERRTRKVMQDWLARSNSATNTTSTASRSPLRSPTRRLKRRSTTLWTANCPARRRPVRSPGRSMRARSRSQRPRACERWRFAKAGSHRLSIRGPSSS